MDADHSLSASGKFKLAAATSGTGLFAAAVLMLLAHSEPRYQGRSLESWLRTYKAGIPEGVANLDAFIPNLSYGPGQERPAQRKSADAVRRMGPRALPVLVRWLHLHYTPWKLRVATYTPRLPKSALTHYVTNWLEQEADCDRCRLAVCGIHILRTNAVTVIPEILSIATDTNAPGAVDAIRCLVEIGPPAVPALTNFLASSRRAAEKVGVMFALERMGPNAEAASTCVAAFLANANTDLASQAATALASIGRKAPITVPALTAALDDNRWTVRFYAMQGLQKLGSSALPAVPKIRSLLGTQYLIDNTARLILEELAPDTLTNAPARPRGVQITGPGARRPNP